jgi:hypothetical protein
MPLCHQVLETPNVSALRTQFHRVFAFLDHLYGFVGVIQRTLE